MAAIKQKTLIPADTPRADFSRSVALLYKIYCLHSELGLKKKPIAVLIFFISHISQFVHSCRTMSCLTMRWSPIQQFSSQGLNDCIGRLFALSFNCYTFCDYVKLLVPSQWQNMKKGLISSCPLPSTTLNINFFTTSLTSYATPSFLSFLQFSWTNTNILYK